MLRVAVNRGASNWETLKYGLIHFQVGTHDRVNTAARGSQYMPEKGRP
jgi:hypothetical protein